MAEKNISFQTTIEVWLTVQNASKAIDFYKQVFNATETYRMEDPGGGLVAKLSVNGAGFWVSGNASENEDVDIKPSDGPIRMILTVNDPDAFF